MGWRPPSPVALPDVLVFTCSPKMRIKAQYDALAYWWFSRVDEYGAKRLY